MCGAPQLSQIRRAAMGLSACDKRVAATQTKGERPDITNGFHLSSGAAKNVAFSLNVNCRPGDEPVVVGIGESTFPFLSIILKNAREYKRGSCLKHVLWEDDYPSEILMAIKDKKGTVRPSQCARKAIWNQSTLDYG